MKSIILVLIFLGAPLALAHDSCQSNQAFCSKLGQFGRCGDLGICKITTEVTDGTCYAKNPNGAWASQCSTMSYVSCTIASSKQNGCDWKDGETVSYCDPTF